MNAKVSHAGKILTLLLLAGVPALAGCSMYQESKITTNRVQVAESQFNQTIPVSDLNASAISGLAQNYVDHGSGPLNLTITYDPKSSSSTAMMAGNHASRIADSLRKQGVDNVQVSILPVNAQGSDSQAIITFAAYDALPPKDCSVMEGVNGTEVIVDQEYKLGCTVDTIFARQIARPKDLNGQGGSGAPTEGRSATNIIDAQRSGALNEPLEGQTASDD